MDFRDTPEDAAFRTEVRDFSAHELPADLRADDDAILGVGVGENPRERTGCATLAKRGWVAPAWPKEYGGAGLSVDAAVHLQRRDGARAAPRPNFLAIGLAGPTIIVHGDGGAEAASTSPASSPARCSGARDSASRASGSDLASLQTRATQDGDDFIINGQKIWTIGRAPRATA